MPRATQKKASAAPSSSATFKKQVQDKAAAAKERVKKINARKLAKYAGVAVISTFSVRALYRMARNVNDTLTYNQLHQDMIPYPPSSGKETSVSEELSRMKVWLHDVERSKRCWGPQRRPIVWLMHVVDKSNLRGVHVNETLLLSASQANVPLAYYIASKAKSGDSANLVQLTQTTGVPNVGWQLSHWYNSTVRYIVVPLVIFLGLGAGHANMVVVNRDTKTIERFDPLGHLLTQPDMLAQLRMFGKFNRDIADTLHTRDEQAFKATLEECEIILDKTIESMLKKHFLGFTYTPPLALCPALAPQTLAELGASSCSKKKAGLCVTWSLMYAHLRLLLPNATPTALAKGLLATYNKNKLADLILRYNAMIERSFPRLFMRYLG